MPPPAVAAPGPIGAGPALTDNNTPFPPSSLIVGAQWTTPRFGPPRNQHGDILLTSWADDDQLYTMINDGGTNIYPPYLWRNSLARISGYPPRLTFRLVRSPNMPRPALHVHLHPGRWRGPLGPYYVNGFTTVNHIFYATRVNNWHWGQNQSFQGLVGTAYSTDKGHNWQFVNQPFGAPTGNLNWVMSGRDTPSPDGYMYAIATEREFNASTLILGRSRPGPENVTDPSQWQWFAGSTQPLLGISHPLWSSQLGNAQPIVQWADHITYPQMTYDAGIGRYLLAFSYSYVDTVPEIWRAGAELVVLEAPHPWGPFSFAFRQPSWGPSNGYGGSFPPKWQSADGRDLWMKWAANFDGCDAGLDCSGAYGFNYAALHLTIAGG